MKRQTLNIIAATMAAILLILIAVASGVAGAAIYVNAQEKRLKEIYTVVIDNWMEDMATAQEAFGNKMDEASTIMNSITVENIAGLDEIKKDIQDQMVEIHAYYTKERDKAVNEERAYMLNVMKNMGLYDERTGKYSTAFIVKKPTNTETSRLRHEMRANTRTMPRYKPNRIMNLMPPQPRRPIIVPMIDNATKIQINTNIDR